MIKLIDIIRARNEHVSARIEAIEKSLRGLPTGQLRINKRNTRTYYYHVPEDNNKASLLDKNHIRFASGLAQRSYLRKTLAAAKLEQELLERIIKRYPKILMEDVAGTLTPERRSLIKPIELSDSEYKEQWINVPYTGKPFKDGEPYYMTMRGERVRSKSEMIIADRLAAKGVPYKYECPLVLEDGTVYHPDFTILRISDRKEIYYEHLGKMDDPGYARINIRRINNYALSNIVTGGRLFLTMETQNDPLDVRVLDRMIENSFL